MNANLPKKPPATVTSEPQVEIEHQVRLRAYELYAARGREDGHDLEDWLRAEEELMETKVLAIAA